MPDLRVLYVQPAACFGGAERQAAQNVRLLPEFGVKAVPMVGPGRRIVQVLEDAGVHDYLLDDAFPHDRKGPRTPAARAALIAHFVRAYFRLVPAIERQIRQRSCHLVLASRPFAWVTAGRAAHRLGIPIVWRAGTGFEHWSQPAWLRFLGWITPPAAVVYNAVAVRDSIRGAVTAPGFVIPNGVDTDRFSPERPLPPLRAELGIPPRAPVVAFAARLAPEKGLDLLVDVSVRLRARVPEVRVLVAGDSDWRPSLEAALHRQGLGETVRLLGYVREIERVYAAADVVLSTSVAEWCSNTLLEAMAMGRAVVATRVGGTRELVRPGLDGVLTDLDPDAIAGAVCGLLADRALCDRLGRSASARVRSSYSQRARVSELAAVLRWAAGLAPITTLETPAENGGISPAVHAGAG